MLFFGIALPVLELFDEVGLMAEKVHSFFILRHLNLFQMVLVSFSFVDKFINFFLIILFNCSYELVLLEPPKWMGF